MNYQTAIARKGPSLPLRWLLKNYRVKGRVLDYGCGRGADVRHLFELGYEVDGYDPYHYDVIPTREYDTILCTYVMNVLDGEEEDDVLHRIRDLLAPNGLAWITCRRDIPEKSQTQRQVHLPYISVYSTSRHEIYRMARYAYPLGSA